MNLPDRQSLNLFFTSPPKSHFVPCDHTTELLALPLSALSLFKMDSKDLSFPPVTDVPLHRNAPLAPTQELAYRKKCIQLKRRLAEIETNNDATRRRIAQEGEHVQKMRLLRAILLNHLNEIMTAPAKKLTHEQLEKLGVLANGGGNMAELAGSGISPELQRSRPEGEGLLDDSSEESDEDEPEVRKPLASHSMRLLDTASRAT